MNPVTEMNQRNMLCMITFKFNCFNRYSFDFKITSDNADYCLHFSHGSSVVFTQLFVTFWLICTFKAKKQ